jgi:hypothetical protein
MMQKQVFLLFAPCVFFACTATSTLAQMHGGDRVSADRYIVCLDVGTLHKPTENKAKAGGDNSVDFRTSGAVDARAEEHSGRILDDEGDQSSAKQTLDDCRAIIAREVDRIKGQGDVAYPILGVFAIQGDSPEATLVFRMNGFVAVNKDGETKGILKNERELIDSLFASLSVTDNDVILFLTSDLLQKTRSIIANKLYGAIGRMLYMRGADARKSTLIAFVEIPTYLYPDSSDGYPLKSYLHVCPFRPGAEVEKRASQQTRIISSDSMNIAAYLARADIWIQAKDTARAIIDFSLALRHIDRRDTAQVVKISTMSAAIRSQIGDKAGAKADLDRLVSMYPERKSMAPPRFGETAKVTQQAEPDTAFNISDVAFKKRVVELWGSENDPTGSMEEVVKLSLEESSEGIRVSYDELVKKYRWNRKKLISIRGRESADDFGITMYSGVTSFGNLVIVGSCFMTADGVRLLRGATIRRSSERTLIERDELSLSKTRSLDRKREAYPTRSGQKWVVVVDGTYGAKHDSIGLIRFSSNGDHVAYSARIGGSWTVVVDGKVGFLHDAIGQMKFSPDGHRLAYSCQRASRWKVVMDVSAESEYDSIGAIEFSSDGLHVGYSALKDKEWVVVVDRMEGPLYESIDGFQFSPNGLHTVYAGRRSGRWTIVLDGRAGKMYDTLSKPTFLDNSLIVYIGRTGSSIERVFQQVQ